MRSSLTGSELPAVPQIYSYQSRVEIWNKQPRFTPLVSVRNEHGDSALDWGEEAAVSVSLATYGDDQVQVAWCPATHGAIDDPTFLRAYNTTYTAQYPRTVRHRKINVPVGKTIDELKPYALDWNWHQDEPVHGLWPVDVRTRVDIHRSAGEATTYACISGAKLYVTSVDDYFNDFDMPGYPSHDEVIGAFTEGTAPAVVGRSEVWVLYHIDETLHLLRWHRELGTQSWVIARRSDWRKFNMSDADDKHASYEHVGWSKWQWWDNTSFRVRAMPDGGRLLSYQSGPGMAVMRVWRDGILSDPYPVMFSDKEYAFQHCRVVDVIAPMPGADGHSRYFAIVERGIEGSDGKISAWFTSLAYSTDGVVWADWAPVGLGRVRGALCVRQGYLCLISPGRFWIALGTTILGTPAGYTLGRIEGWRINQRAGSVATVGETQGVSFDTDHRPQPGDELRRYLTVNTLYDYRISTEEVDSIEPRRAHNQAALSVQSRGPLKAGIVYRPPVDEVFSSGDVRFVEFEEQTVVEKVGRFVREEGAPSVENGHVLCVEKGAWRVEKLPDPDYPDILIDTEVPTGEPAIAILPQPVRPGSFWVNARLTAWADHAGVVFGYHDPLIDSDPDNDDEETALNYWAVRWLNPKLQLVRVKDGATTLLQEAELSPAVQMPEIAVRVQNNVIQVLVSEPAGLPVYGADLAASHAKNVELDNVGWRMVMNTSVNDLPTEATYVGILGLPGAKFRNLQMVEIDHIQTLGRLVDAISRRSGMHLDRPQDLTFGQNFFAADLSIQGTAAMVAEGAWYRQKDPWILQRRFLGFDVEMDLDFLNSSEELSVVFNSQHAEAYPWGAGGLELAISPQRFTVRRRGLTEQVVEGTQGWMGLYEDVHDVASYAHSMLFTRARARLVLYAVNERRSVLAIYLNGRWMWAFTLDYATLGGYFGMRGSGRWQNLQLSSLPQFIGDHIWSYRRSAVDEIKELVRNFNYQLLEEANGRVRLCAQDSVRSVIGDLPATMEVSAHSTAEAEASVIRVAGAEVYATYVDPRLLGLVGFRVLEVDMPYLWTEKQCLDHARMLADLFYAESLRRSAAGAADPRLEINDVYNTLDVDGVRRGYLVDAISFTVNQVREPHADVRVELRRLD